MAYPEPMVTISLAEYNELKENAKTLKEGRVEQFIMLKAHLMYINQRVIQRHPMGDDAEISNFISHWETNRDELIKHLKRG